MEIRHPFFLMQLVTHTLGLISIQCLRIQSLHTIQINLGEVQGKAVQISNGFLPFIPLGVRPIAYQDTWENVLEHALMVSQNSKEENILNHEERIASLSEMAYYVTQQNGTERPFTGILNKEYRKGDYFCIVCDITVHRPDEI